MTKLLMQSEKLEYLYKYTQEIHPVQKNWKSMQSYKTKYPTNAYKV